MRRHCRCIPRCSTNRRGARRRRFRCLKGCLGSVGVGGRGRGVRVGIQVRGRAAGIRVGGRAGGAGAGGRAGMEMGRGGARVGGGRIEVCCATSALLGSARWNYATQPATSTSTSPLPATPTSTRDTSYTYSPRDSPHPSRSASHIVHRHRIIPPYIPTFTDAYPPTHVYSIPLVPPHSTLNNCILYHSLIHLGFEIRSMESSCVREMKMRSNLLNCDSE